MKILERRAFRHSGHLTKQLITDNSFGGYWLFRKHNWKVDWSGEGKVCWSKSRKIEGNRGKIK